MAWPTYNQPHFCLYRRLQGSSVLIGQTMTWIERCRCMKVVNVSLSRSETEKKVKVHIEKHWFDRDGKLERITGTNDS